MELQTRNVARLVRGVPRLMIPALFTVVRRANTQMAVLQTRGFSASARSAAAPALSPLGAADVALVGAGLAVLALALADRLGAVPIT